MALLLFLSLGFLLYFQAIFYPFVHDEIVFIHNNPDIAHIHLGQIFFPASESTNSIINSSFYYRPLTDLTYRVLYQIFGLNPQGFHFFNIFIHCLNAFLIYLIARSIPALVRTALPVGFLFLIHPVQTESVACVSGLSSLLMGFFLLLSLYFYINKDVKGHRLWISIGCFALSMLAKEQAIILPLVFILYEMCFKEQRFSTASKSVLAVVLVAIIYLFARKVILGASFVSINFFSNEFWLRMMSIPQTLWMYVSLIFWPHDLHYYRSIDILKFSIWPIVGLMLSLGLLLWFFRRRDVVFGLGWFLIFLLPVLNFIPLINEYSFILAAEHFLYLPIVGLAIIFVVLIETLLKRFSRQSLFIFVPMGLVLSVISFNQIQFWKNEVVLFERMIRFEPNFGRGHLLLAKAHLAQKNIDEAINHYGRAEEIMAGYVQRSNHPRSTSVYREYLKEIHRELGYCLSVYGDWEHALTHYKDALNLDPKDPFIYNSLALSYIENGHWPEAVQWLKKGLDVNPGNVLLRNNLSLIENMIKEDQK